jgi:hypothetical protein
MLIAQQILTETAGKNTLVWNWTPRVIVFDQSDKISYFSSTYDCSRGKSYGISLCTYEFNVTVVSHIA